MPELRLEELEMLGETDLPAEPEALLTDNVQRL